MVQYGAVGGFPVRKTACTQSFPFCILTILHSAVITSGSASLRTCGWCFQVLQAYTYLYITQHLTCCKLALHRTLPLNSCTQVSTSSNSLHHHAPRTKPRSRKRYPSAACSALKATLLSQSSSESSSRQVRRARQHDPRSSCPCGCCHAGCCLPGRL